MKKKIFRNRWLLVGIACLAVLGVIRVGISLHAFLKRHHLIYHVEQESPLAHRLLDGLSGIEIGASAQNPFGLNTRNVDFSDDYTTVYKQEEVASTGKYVAVDIVASGDTLPLEDNSVGFVVSSHVIEHFYDPIKAIKEWLRVTRPGGYVYIIAPHKQRTFDRHLPRTTLVELIDRHEHPNPPVPDHHGHYSVWITEDFLELCNHFGWKIIAWQDIDDKVGNGFTIVIQKALFDVSGSCSVKREGPDTAICGERLSLDLAEEQSAVEDPLQPIRVLTETSNKAVQKKGTSDLLKGEVI